MGTHKIFDVHKLFFTDGNCCFGGLKRPGVGFLVDEYGKPIYPVIKWLMLQRTRRPDPEDVGTIKQQAADLRMFWEFLSREKKDWQKVNDRFLMLWRDRMYGGIRVSKGQESLNEKTGAVQPITNGMINRRTSTVLRFYIWCQEQELVDKQMVGTGGKFRLTWKYGGKDKKCRVWIGNLTTEDSAPSGIADDADVEKLHDVLDQIYSEQTASRNRLYIDWNRYVGLRGLEASSLKVDMIPPMDEIQKYIDDEKVYPMDFSPKRQGVRTKGGKSRPKPLDVDPMLLMHTREYIDYYRPEIVERAKKHFGHSYKESDAVFLSTSGSSLGQQIKTKSIQSVISRAIKIAGLKITPHFLRKMFAMEIVKNLYLGKYLILSKEGYNHNFILSVIDDNSIITYASQQLGHKYKTTTIKHYLDMTKLKLLAMSGQVRLQYLDRHKFIALAAVKNFQPEIEEGVKSSLQKYALAEAAGLQKALDDGDKEKVFEILKKHVLK